MNDKENRHRKDYVKYLVKGNKFPKHANNLSLIHI